MLSLSMLLQNHFIYIYIYACFTRASCRHKKLVGILTNRTTQCWKHVGDLMRTAYVQCDAVSFSRHQCIWNIQHIPPGRHTEQRSSAELDIIRKKKKQPFTLFRPMGNGTAQPLYRLLAIVAGQTCTHGVLKATALSERQCSSNVDSLQCAHRHSMLQSHVFRHKCYTDINGIKIPALVKARDFDCD